MNLLPYQQLKPCIDENGHRFVASEPPPDQYGSVVIYCARCGKFQGELNRWP